MRSRGSTTVTRRWWHAAALLESVPRLVGWVVVPTLVLSVVVFVLIVWPLAKRRGLVAVGTSHLQRSSEAVGEVLATPVPLPTRSLPTPEPTPFARFLAPAPSNSGIRLLREGTDVECELGGIPQNYDVWLFAREEGTDFVFRQGPAHIDAPRHCRFPLSLFPGGPGMGPPVFLVSLTLVERALTQDWVRQYEQIIQTGQGTSLPPVRLADVTAFTTLATERFQSAAVSTRTPVGGGTLAEK
jgi:hypothetical protein